MIKRICLIFTPFSAFSYIPGGIFGLKSYLVKKLEDIEISAVDLNNRLYKRIMNRNFWKIDNLCQICPVSTNCTKVLNDKKKLERKLNQCLEIRNVFLKDKGRLLHRDKEVPYLRLLTKFNNFLKEIGSCFDIQINNLFLKENKCHLDVLYEIFRDDISELLELKPQLIGFSIFCREQFNISLLLAKLIKTKAGIPIVIGGAFISTLDVKHILDKLNFIDYIIYNEGERGLLELVKNIEGGNLTNVPNLVYRHRGHIIKNFQKSVEKIDELPVINIENIRLKDYFSPVPVISVGFSRGCYWKKCTFCALHQMFDLKYRIKTIDYFLEELRYYYSNGIRHFIMHDEVIPAAQMYLLSKAIIKAGLKINYFFMARPTRDFTYDILKSIYSSGCRIIFWGMESGCQNVLNAINKGTNLDDIKMVLRDCYKAGIPSIVAVIQGFPLQKREDTLANREFLLENSKYVYKYSIVSYHLDKHSYMGERYSDFGILEHKPKILLRLKNNRKIYDNSSESIYKYPSLKVDLECIRGDLKTIASIRKQYLEHLLIELSR